MRTLTRTLLVPMLAVVAPHLAVAAETKVGPWDVKMTSPGEPGDPLIVEGRVLGADGRPRRDLRLHAYHADAAGRYGVGDLGSARLSVLLRTNLLGEFRLRTVMPGRPEGNPHIHFEIEAPGEQYWATSLNFCRSEGAGSDTTLAVLPWLLQMPSSQWAPVRRDADGVVRCRWDLRLADASRQTKRPSAFRH